MWHAGAAQVRECRVGFKYGMCFRDMHPCMCVSTNSVYRMPAHTHTHMHNVNHTACRCIEACVRLPVHALRSIPRYSMPQSS